MDFGSKMGPFLAPSRASKTGAPSTYFDIAPKKRPRPLQECPRAPQERPKSVPRVPKSVLRPSKSVQNVPMGRPRCLQRGIFRAFLHFLLFLCAFLRFFAFFCAFLRFSVFFNVVLHGSAFLWVFLRFSVFSGLAWLFSFI